MTMATETENTGPESKEIKDVKEMKEALKDESPPDNKQEEKDAAKKEESGKKEETGDAAATAASPAPTKAISVHKTNFEKDIVYLYQFPRTPVLPSISPYCLKVETWLRLNGIKYEVSPDPLSSSRPTSRRHGKTRRRLGVLEFSNFSPFAAANENNG